MKIALNTSCVSVGGMDYSGFESLGEVVYFGEVSKESLFALAADCDAIIVNKTVIDEEFLNACPKIKYVGVFATGYNLIDTVACRARGITVCNVPEYSTNSVAQHVFALLLNFMGAISDYTSAVRRGEWITCPTFAYPAYPTYTIAGKTFGVFGYGNIGRKVAGIADAFGAKVIVCTHPKRSDCPYRQVTFEEMLKECDIISLHCPLTNSTANMINAHALAQMKPTAVLINTARGGLVDEAALAEALNSGALAGACLDTVAEEPMLENNPLRTAKNCYITPHIAWIARETRLRLVKIAEENLRAFINGTPQNVVD